MKLCSKCKIEKSYDDFYKSSQTKDGYKCYCKACIKIDNQSREHLYKEYRAERCKSGKAKENKRKYYQEKKDEILNANRAWRNSLIGRYTSYKKGAESRDLEFNLTIDEFKTFWQVNCHYCNSKVETIGLDRVDNAQGYILQNIVPCCYKCNSMKMDSSYDDFVSSIIAIYNNLGLQKCNTPTKETF